MIYITYTLILLLSISYIQYATGYKWFAMTSYSNSSCNYNTIKQITLFQAQKCTQVNTNGVITSTSTDCTIAGNKILRTISNWTNGFCEGAFSYTGPFNQNKTYQNGVCESPAGTTSGYVKYSCDTDPDYENWPGLALYDANAYTSCSPYYGPFVIYAQAPSCMQVGSSSTIWTCGTTAVTQYTYNPSNNCTSKGNTYTANSYNLDSCISSSSQNSYYSCPLTILPGVAFLAIGNDALGKKVINKAFVGGIFSGILFVVFVLMLGLTTLFYYRRIYRPLKKLILELANNDESNRDSRQALENVGVGSFCSWLCSCGMINKEEIKKLGE